MFEACSPSPDPVAPAPLAPARDVVLLLEDNECIAQMLTHLLVGQGLQVVWCPLGSRALAEFERRSDRVALLLADCRLPDMDGREVGRRLQQRQPGLPVLLTSGNGTLRSLAPLAAGRLVAFLPKPYTPGEILERIRTLLTAAGTAPAARPSPKNGYV